MRRFLGAALLVCAPGLSADPFIVEDLHKAKANAKVESICRTCHGMDGLGTIAGVPNLSGQKYDYLVIQLEAYRNAKRHHPQMSIIAQMLSDADIRNVAKWYSSIKITVELPE